MIMTALKLPDDRILILAAAGLYILLALIVSIRKKQSVPAWLIAAVIQTGTVWHFGQICEVLGEYLPPLLERVGITMLSSSGIPKPACAVICMIANILLILLLNAFAIAPAKRRSKNNKKNEGAESEDLKRLQKDIAAAAMQINSAEKNRSER